MIPNANVCTSSFDRISGSLSSPAFQPVNNFRIQTAGANIIQGQVNKLSVTEIMMPYDIPTIVRNQNSFFYLEQSEYPIGGGLPSSIATLPITIPGGFYTGPEIATTINNSLSTATSSLLTCTYNTTSGCISFNNTAVWNPSTINTAYEILPSQSVSDLVLTNIFNNPSALWTLGFRNLYASNPTTTNGSTITTAFALTPSGYPQATYPTLPGFTSMTGSVYTGAYTNYIDIVSPSLCQAQYVRDATTSQATAKKDVIARVYVCDNVSLATSNQIASRPFMIYRIFPCPKVMKWTVDRSLDAIQLELFDMYGQKLLIPTNTTSATLAGNATNISSGGRDYALTLHVHEPGDEVQNENVGYRF